MTEKKSRKAHCLKLIPFRSDYQREVVLGERHTDMTKLFHPRPILVDFRVWQQHVDFQSCRVAPVDGIDFDFFSLWQEKICERCIIYGMLSVNTSAY
jgi:hypothetical protein